MQGIKESVAFLALAILLAKFVSQQQGQAHNRTAFYKDLRDGKSVVECLGSHGGAYNRTWFLAGAMAYLVITLGLSLIPEALYFDFPTNTLIILAIGIGLLVFVPCFFLLKRTDLVPPVPGKSEE